MKEEPSWWVSFNYPLTAAPSLDEEISLMKGILLRENAAWDHLGWSVKGSHRN